MANVIKCIYGPSPMLGPRSEEEVRLKKRWLLLVGLLGCTLCALAQGTETQGGTLSGVVMASDGQPLPGSRVTLSYDPSFYPPTAGPSSTGESTVTDDKGKYTLEGVSPGVFLLSAEVAGYIKQAYGGKPGYFGSYNGRVLPSAATPIVVGGNSKISGLDIRLTRLGAISGRVTSATGDPAEAIPVYAVRWTYLDGSRRLLEKGRTATNSRGEFRIEGLAPGQYYVYAVPPNESTRPGQPMRSRLPTYSPNALGYREAIAVTLAPGSDGFGDVRLREDAQITIRGTVAGLRGDSALEGATVLLMEDADTPLAGGLVGAPGPTPPPPTQSYLAITYANENGEFELKGVMPGQHRLIALGGKSPALNTSTEAGRRWTAPLTKEPPGPNEGNHGSVDLLIGNENVEDVMILLRPGGEITSKIAMDSGSYRDWARERIEKSRTPVPEERKARILAQVPEVTLIPQAGVAVGGNFPGTADGMGGFTQRVTPGRYFLSVSGANVLYYVKSVRLGNADVTRKPFDFGGGAVDMVITLGTDAGRVTGFVTDDDGNQVKGAPVSLWPAVPDQTQRNGGVLRVSSRHDGSFVFPFVPPGDYYAIAFEDLPDPGLAEYPAFVSQFTAAGERIKVEPNQGPSTRLKAIGAQEVERTLATLQ